MQATPSCPHQYAVGLGSVLLCVFTLASAAGATSGPAPAAEHIPGNVHAARLKAADAEPQNWFAGGRDADGTYYSPLATINASNVKDLGFAWEYDLGSPRRGQEATPVVVDGILYT
ncbi:MAG: PQQ-dependent dehydrogenase, methanol/ethanol family, partial [Pseudomonadota bacterium]|nr:PQQ-dependent dehydrogenase, methanol/ethanol family [Pseudomonadota bacterium]